MRAGPWKQFHFSIFGDQEIFIVLNMSYIISPNLAYLQKALTFESFSSGHPRDQNDFLLSHLVVKG